MNGKRQVSPHNVLLLVLLMLGPLFIYHIIMTRFLMQHLMAESRKGDPDRWFAQNDDLVSAVSKTYGLRLLSNTAIPGSIRVSVYPGSDVAKARLGLNNLRNELFKRHCPYGITVVDFDDR